MGQDLEHAAADALQQRLVEELASQQRLQEELRTALENERGLRLENDLLWAYLEREEPQRVKDARGLLERLAAGSDLAIELHDPQRSNAPSQRSVKRRVRGAIGKLPGVHRIYHGLKNLRK